MVPHIHTLDGITLVLFGKPYSVPSDAGYYGEVVRAVQDGAEADSILDILHRTAKKVENVQNLVPGMSYSAGVVMYNGEALAGYAVDKLIDIIEARLNPTPLARFLENLQLNPSKRVVDDLYRFLEKGKMPITDDGYFLAYKKVRENYADIHSGKFSNRIGSLNQMQRNRVDEDPNRTCSTGFHVCSYDYLPQFAGGAGERVVVCKVHPADVVAIPADYNDTKMRVAAYEVVEEVTDYFQRDERILSSKPIFEREYIVIEESDWSGPEEDDRYFSLEEAQRQADFLANETDADKVYVERLGGEGEVLYWAKGQPTASELGLMADTETRFGCG
jgi:hypothetical protein